MIEAKSDFYKVTSTSGIDALVYTHYRGDVTLDAPGNSDFVIVPKAVSSVSYMLKPGASSSGKVQYTLDALVDVIAGTATWIDAPDGVVTSAIANTYHGSATAFRAVCVLGTLKVAFVMGSSR